MKNFTTEKNFLPLELIKAINAFVSHNARVAHWYSNLSWQEDTVQQGNGISTLRIPGHFEEKLKQLYTDYNPELKGKKLLAEYCVGPGGSYVPWHYDDNYGIKKIGSTIFLNKKWDRNEGGLYLYEKNNNIYGEVPEFNKMILNDHTLYHALSMVATKAVQPSTVLQVWMWEAKTEGQTRREERRIKEERNK